MKANRRDRAKYAWVLAILWCAFSTVITIVNVVDPPINHSYRWLILAMDILGLGLTGFAVRATLAWKKSGDTTL